MNKRRFARGQPSGTLFGLHFWDSIDHFCFWWLLRFQGEICGNASHPVAFVSVVAFCDLFTPFHLPSPSSVLWAVHLGPSGARSYSPTPSLWAVHLGPSGVSSQPTTLTHLNLSLHLATLQAVHLGPSGVFAIVPLPAPLQNPPLLHSLEAVHLGPSWVTIIFTFTTSHISPNHTTFHISSLRAVHLGPSGVAIPVPLPLPLPSLYPFFPFIPSCSGPSI